MRVTRRASDGAAHTEAAQVYPPLRAGSSARKNHLTSLPPNHRHTRDMVNPRVFFDVSVDAKPLGRCVCARKRLSTATN